MIGFVTGHPVLSGKSALGDGLSKAIVTLIKKENSDTLSIDSIISDMNGETYRAFEWAVIQPRSMNTIGGEKNLIRPAQSIGDTGAASAGVAICQAAQPWPWNT
ncbi:MAG: hypothetical protein KKD44_10130 [Proteobacteria bacterium]|nr:hypothetical protein [Pseudomonadota bacterium]